MQSIENFLMRPDPTSGNQPNHNPNATYVQNFIPIVIFRRFYVPFSLSAQSFGRQGFKANPTQFDLARGWSNSTRWSTMG